MNFIRFTMHSFFITGTDTGVGKTYITAQLANMFRQSGYDVGVMKPVSTGGRADARYLLKHTGLKDPLDLVNPIHFKRPLAPTIAAQLESKRMTIGHISRILNAYKKLKARHKDGIMIEGIGGLMVPFPVRGCSPIPVRGCSPIGRDYMQTDLIKELGLPVIIVSRPQLGTINHTLLTINALKSLKIPISGFIVNYHRHAKGLTERLSPGIIEKISGVGQIKIPFIRERLRHIKCGAAAESRTKHRGGGPKTCPDYRP